MRLLAALEVVLAPRLKLVVPGLELPPSASVMRSVVQELVPELAWPLAVSRPVQQQGLVVESRLWVVQLEKQQLELGALAFERPVVAVAGPRYRQGGDRDTP